MIIMKKELRFKESSPGDGAAWPIIIADSTDAVAIQKLYRQNRKKALRNIYNEESDFCSLDPERLADHYNTTSIDRLDDTAFMKEIEPERETMNTNYFTKKEFAGRLWKCDNTAPNPDGITYKYLKLIDPNAIALTHLYNLCLKFQAVPGAWKRTTTIAIYKKGEKENPSYWRPIALGNMIYKRYVCAISTRLYKWFEKNDNPSIRKAFGYTMGSLKTTMCSNRP